MSLPTNNEQYMLELVNRMRADPHNELGRLLDSIDPISSPDGDIDLAVTYFNVNGTVLQQQWEFLSAAPPLAWSEIAAEMATEHSMAMIETDTQGHHLPGYSSFWERVEDYGLASCGASENVFAFSDTVFYSHAGFAIDWEVSDTGIQDPPGHRENIMDPAFHQAGIAIIEENNPETDVGPLIVTQNFIGCHDPEEPYVLGVVYNDLDGDDFYSPGEGLGGVLVSINGETVETWASGGYQIAVPAGTHTATFSGGPLDGPVTRSVTVTSENRKLDLVLGGHVNTRPDAVDDLATIELGTATPLNVLANDSDADGDTLSIDSWTDPAHGTLPDAHVAAYPFTGALEYKPAPGFTGTDTFAYTISDGNGGTDTATVTVTVGGGDGDHETTADPAEFVALSYLMVGEPPEAGDPIHTQAEIGGSLLDAADDMMSDGDFVSQFSFASTLNQRITIITVLNLGLTPGSPAEDMAHTFFSVNLINGVAPDVLFTRAVEYLLNDSVRDPMFDDAAATLRGAAAVTLSAPEEDGPAVVSVDSTLDEGLLAA